MFEGGKEVGRRGVWLLVVVLFGVALIVFVYPQIRALRLQTKAGKLIEEHVARVQEEQPETAEGNFYCIIPTMQSGSLEGNNLDQAIQWLNEAKSLAPNNVHSSFLLGQAYCLKEDYERAVDALDEFLILRPENLLARAEIGFAFSALARSAADPQVAQTYQSVSLQYLEQAGFSEISFINLGDAAFKQERYQDALAWYGVVESISELETSKLFRYALLQLVLEGSSPYADKIKDEMILDLDGTLIIEPSDFFMLLSGSSVKTSVEVDRTIGALNANTSDAGILLNVYKAKKFCISGQVLDKPPAPTQIGIDMDFETLKILDLVNGDGNWVEFNLDAHLEPGLHILGVKLMNDLYIKGEIDRNAYIGLITINPCE